MIVRHDHMGKYHHQMSMWCKVSNMGSDWLCRMTYEWWCTQPALIWPVLWTQHLQPSYTQPVLIWPVVCLCTQNLCPAIIDAASIDLTGLVLVYTASVPSHHTCSQYWSDQSCVCVHRICVHPSYTQPVLIWPVMCLFIQHLCPAIIHVASIDLTGHVLVYTASVSSHHTRTSYTQPVLIWPVLSLNSPTALLWHYHTQHAHLKDMLSFQSTWMLGIVLTLSHLTDSSQSECFSTLYNNSLLCESVLDSLIWSPY